MVVDYSPQRSVAELEHMYSSLSAHLIDIVEYFFKKFGIVDNPIPFFIDH
jgi:transposase